MLRENISTILFDIGGVLVELHGTPFKPEWLQNTQVDSEVWTCWHNSMAVSAFESGEISVDVFAEQFILEAGLNTTSSDFIEHFMNWPARLFDGVPEMLSLLGKRYRLAILSNSNALHWPKLTCEMALENYVTDCISSHQIGVMKPDQRAFEKVLEIIDVPAEEVLFLDDLQKSVDMAGLLGIQAVKVTGRKGGVETAKAIGLLSD